MHVKRLDKENCMAIVLVGGKGDSLSPLTHECAKPAVTFGGAYRIIDFTLSNCLNSGLRKTLMLTQYKPMSLDQHIDLGWRNYFCRRLGEFIAVVPPQQRLDESWYKGTADAVYQNIYHIERERPTNLIILAGDHVYKMDYRKLVEFHALKAADLTIASLPVRREEAKRFGVMAIDSDLRVIGFQEKPYNPTTMPNDGSKCLASMGIYVFDTRFLFEMLCRDASKAASKHDFGHDLIPDAIRNNRVFTFPFGSIIPGNIPGNITGDDSRKQNAYWRDIGTLDAYYQANMDLIAVEPQLDVYDTDWPIRTYQPQLPPPKFVFSGTGDPRRVGIAIDSIVCHGSVVSGGRIERSILGRNVRINSYARVDDSIVNNRVTIGRGARIRRAIIDDGVEIPAGASIGIDHAQDRANGFHVTDEGVVVVSRFCCDPQHMANNNSISPNLRQTPDDSSISGP